MGQSAKAIVGLLALIGVIATVVVWCADWEPTWESWAWRLGITAGGVGFVTLALWAEWRPDKVPDFLKALCKRYLEVDGVCFALLASEENHVAYLDVWYQNRFERKCNASIVLKPGKGFFLNRPKIKSIRVVIEAGPAGFGHVRVPFPIPEKFQGKTMSFDIGGSSSYRHGKGNMLRFRDGMAVGKTTGTTAGQAALTIAAAFAGAIVISNPASCKICLPEDVAEEMPEDAEVVREELWTLGDPIPEGAPRSKATDETESMPPAATA